MKYSYTTFMGLVMAAPALANTYSSAPYPSPEPNPIIGLSCPQACENAFNECRNKPGANISTCVSDKQACLATCGGGYDDDDEYPSSSSASSYASSYAPAPTPTPYPEPKPECKTCKDSKPVIGLSCPQACENAFNECRSKPGANISYCSSEKAACIATCGLGPVPSPTPYPVPKPDCAKTCEDKFNACRSKPGANISYCASEKAACLAACGEEKPMPTSSSAYGSETTAPVYVAGGDSIKPTIATWTLGLGALLMLF
ncbi:hypothetical protein CP532_3835 [Ophiocordyceps camponoti-leonardi (nom. inval.)]|nr:hypothetical protein CP532_3835 [Ophiocordyceps camponoti-leonardi (nom. inval.)]